MTPRQVYGERGNFANQGEPTGEKTNQRPFFNAFHPVNGTSSQPEQASPHPQPTSVPPAVGTVTAPRTDVPEFDPRYILLPVDLRIERYVDDPDEDYGFTQVELLGWALWLLEEELKKGATFRDTTRETHAVKSMKGGLLQAQRERLALSAELLATYRTDLLNQL